MIAPRGVKPIVLRSLAARYLGNDPGARKSLWTTRLIATFREYYPMHSSINIYVVSEAIPWRDVNVLSRLMWLDTLCGIHRSVALIRSPANRMISSCIPGYCGLARYLGTVSKFPHRSYRCLIHGE